MTASSNIYIITNEGFMMSSWRDDWPEATIITPININVIDNPAIIIIPAETQNWIDIIKHYARLGVPTLVLSRQGDVDELNRAMQAGTRGYINLFSPIDTLKLAAESIIGGAFWVPPKYLEHLLQLANETLSTQETNIPDPFSQLSKREVEVAELVIQGFSNKKIANELDICERTVKLHMSSILNKLNISDRIQLILLKKGNI